MNKIEKLKDNLECYYKIMKKEIEELKKEVTKNRWRAKTNEDDYYYIDSFGYIYKETEENEKKDDFRYKTRNYFKTKEQAQAYLDNINTYYDLMDLADKLNSGEEIDWEDQNQIKYYLYYDFVDYELKTDYCYHHKDLGQIYCLYKDFFNIGLERIGEDRLKKLFAEVN